MVFFFHLSLHQNPHKSKSKFKNRNHQELTQKSKFVFDNIVLVSFCFPSSFHKHMINTDRKDSCFGYRNVNKNKHRYENKNLSHIKIEVVV